MTPNKDVIGNQAVVGEFQDPQPILVARTV
jgi:hypothetical protein